MFFVEIWFEDLSYRISHAKFQLEEGHFKVIAEDCGVYVTDFYTIE